MIAVMQPDDFGRPIGNSRWFSAEPEVKDGRWICPLDGGEMVYTGISWLSNPSGHHHTCNKCGFTAAPRSGRRFPEAKTG
jgi:predicted RNA-binding Zn-ribbon protein involved in translation (DUF1610 family)